MTSTQNKKDLHERTSPRYTSKNQSTNHKKYYLNTNKTSINQIPTNNIEYIQLPPHVKLKHLISDNKYIKNLILTEISTNCDIQTSVTNLLKI